MHALSLCGIPNLKSCTLVSENDDVLSDWLESLISKKITTSAIPF